MTGPGKHAALAAELEKKRQDRMAKLSALWGIGHRRVEYRPDDLEPVDPEPRRGARKGGGR